MPIALLLAPPLLWACDRNHESASTPHPNGAAKEVEKSELPPAPPEPEGAAEAAAADTRGARAEPPPASPVPDATPQADDVDPALARALQGLTSWVRAHGGQVHATLVDLEADRRLLGHRHDEAVNPASNTKLLTAAAALDLLGPAYTFRTELRGDISPDGKAKVLALRGGGAPDLTTEDLYRLARVAKGQNLEKVEAIVVDQGRFSEDFIPPAFDQQPEEWAPFRAPISALAINRNQISLNVLSTKQGQPAHVWYEPPGVVQPRGVIKTGAAGSGDKVTWSLNANDDPRHLVSQVGGSIAENLGRRRYERRLDDPRLAPGHAMAAILREQGVEVGREVRLGSSEGEPLISYLPSEALAELIAPLGKESDNFTAEMVLVALSQVGESEEDSKPWSSARGARRLVEWLKRGQVPLDGVVIKNGSGLFDANRLTPEVIAHVLARMEARPEVFPEYLSQLAILGTDGTLARRGRKDSMRGRIRAKTGTLRDVNALSGFILRRDGRRPAAFSVIVSGVRGRHGEVRTEIDRAVSAWAGVLDR